MTICKYCNEKVIEKHHYQKRHRIPWNKGLTKESSEKVKSTIEKMRNTVKKLYINGRISPRKNIKHSEKTKELISNSVKKIYESKKLSNKLYGWSIYRSKYPEAVNKKIVLDEKILIDLYVNQNKTGNEIAKKLNVKSAIIYKNLKRYNIPRRLGRKSNKEMYGEQKSLEIKKKMSMNRMNLTESEWNSIYNQTNRYTFDFNFKFKELIRERDERICQLCNKLEEDLDKRLDIHHIDYNRRNSFQQNCISLCRNCHSLTQSNREEWTKFFQNLLKNRYNYEYTENQKIIINFNEDDTNEKEKK